MGIRHELIGPTWAQYIGYQGIPIALPQNEVIHQVLYFIPYFVLLNILSFENIIFHKVYKRFMVQSSI